MRTHGNLASARSTQAHLHSQRHQAPQHGPPTKDYPIAVAPTTTPRPTAAQPDNRASQPLRPNQPAETDGRQPINHKPGWDYLVASTSHYRTTQPNRVGSPEPTRRPDRIVEPNPNSHEPTDHPGRANRIHPTDRRSRANRIRPAGQPNDVSRTARCGPPSQPTDADQHCRSGLHHRTVQADRASSPGLADQATGTGRRIREDRTDYTSQSRCVALDRLAAHARRLDIAHPLNRDQQSDLAYETGAAAQLSRASQRGHTGMLPVGWPHSSVGLARDPNRNGDALLLTEPTRATDPASPDTRAAPPLLGEPHQSISRAVSGIAHGRSLDVNSPSFRIVVAAHVLCGQRRHTPETTPWTSQPAKPVPTSQR